MTEPSLESEIVRQAAPLIPGSAALSTFLAATRAQTLAKGQTLFRAGEPTTALYFVTHGLLRYYYLADGAEHTGQFFDAGLFLGDVASLMTGADSVQTVDAIEASTVIVIPGTALKAAYDADHAMERFGRRVVEQAMAGSQRRSAALLQLSPEENYERLLRLRPEVARRTPLYMIASYLGVTPEALSRIRRRRIGS